jgi:hypothetical protein
MINLLVRTSPVGTPKVSDDALAVMVNFCID